MAVLHKRAGEPEPGTAPPSKAAQQLDVLHPEREVRIADRILVVREYGFVEGLQILPKAGPILDALKAYAAAGSGLARYSQIEQVFAEHTETMIELVAQAADVTPDFVRGLSDEDGFRLMQVWWLANQGFFLRRLVQALATARADAKRAGPGSTPPSSAPASGERQETSAA